MKPTVTAALVAGVVALITGAIGALATIGVARYRGRIDQQLQTRLKIAEARLPAYQALWKCMAPVSMTTPGPLGRQARRDFDAALTRFCTSTCAWSRLVPSLKVTVMLIRPSFVDDVER